MKKRSELTGEVFGRKVPGTISSADLFAAQPLQETAHVTFRLDPDDGLGLPVAIIPAKNDSENLFASVATYYPNHSPLSALMHVIEPATDKYFLKTCEAGGQQREIRPNYRRAYIGAAFGEAMLASLGSPDSAGPSYAACKRSLAFCLCRAHEVYGDEFDANLLAARWESLRRTAGLAISKGSVEAVKLLGALLDDRESDSSQASSNKTLWQEFVRLVRSGDEERLFDALIDTYPNAKAYAKDLGGSFDGRLVAFMKMVEVINATSKDQSWNDIAIGYFCNKIQPGSFVHSGVLMHLVEMHPTSLIWYGLFSAISDRNEPFSFSSSLVAKLIRDLNQSFSFSDRPEADISFEELRVLSRGKLKHEMINPGHARALLVSLFPGVNVYTRFGAEPPIPADRPSNQNALDQRDKITKLLENALSLLSGAPETSKSPSYSPASRKKKR